jgi:hypothetical protein
MVVCTEGFGGWAALDLPGTNSQLSKEIEMSRAVVSCRRIGALIAVASFLVVAAPAAAQAPPPDSDGDGYSDNQDVCPTTPGGPQGPYNAPGCPVPPDSDGDGYPDPNDGCPTTPGGPQGPANGPGCPAPKDPDLDDDGVSNEYDACPSTPGSRDAQGCPDGDGDWIRDSEDACPNAKGPVNDDGQGEGNGCPDDDRDGVKDSDDACPTQGGSKYGGGVDQEGCPARVTAFFNFPMTNTWEMAQGKRQLAVCKDTPRLVHCTMRMIVSLTDASAKRLGIKNPELLDRVVKTSKRSAFHEMVTGPWQWRPSDALKAALKKDGRSVTIIVRGSYKVAGSGEWKKLDRQKVVVKPKSCGWNRFSCV